MMHESIPQTEYVQKVQETSEALEFYVAPFCGDVFKSAVDKFPTFEILLSVPVYLDPESAFVSGGLNANGDIGIWIGQAEGLITTSMKSRINERFKLPYDVLDQPDILFMPIILAHELGHVIQADPQFEGIFGKIDTNFVSPEADYEGYVQSDLELNADYIAALIVGDTSFGSFVGIESPRDPPQSWREWGIVHPIPNTIAINTGHTT
jgi:hypothetical protein